MSNRNSNFVTETVSLTARSAPNPMKTQFRVDGGENKILGKIRTNGGCG